MICCIGDLHLDKLTRLIPEFNKHLAESLSFTIRSVRKKGCTNFVFMGDVFDTSSSSFEGNKMLLEIFRSFPECQFFLLLGNHDFSDINNHSLQTLQLFSVLSEMSNFHVIDKPKRMAFEGTVVYMCPHPYVKPSKKKVHWNLGHFAVNGAKSDNGFSIRTKNAPKGRWVLGDFHTPQSIKGPGYYTYVGSFAQMSFSESPSKRVLVLDKRETRSVKVNLGYTLKSIKIKEEGDFDKDYSKLDSYLRAEIYSSLKVPDNFLSRNPNILRIQPRTAKKDRRAAVILNSIKESKPTAHLEAYLSKKGFEGKVLDRALEIAETLHGKD